MSAAITWKHKIGKTFLNNQDGKGEKSLEEISVLPQGVDKKTICLTVVCYTWPGARKDSKSKELATTEKNLGLKGPEFPREI